MFGGTPDFGILGVVGDGASDEPESVEVVQVIADEGELRGGDSG